MAAQVGRFIVDDFNLMPLLSQVFLQGVRLEGSAAVVNIMACDGFDEPGTFGRQNLRVE